jgi:hypothetical protein
MANFNVLEGKILTNVEVLDVDEKILFTTNDGMKYIMYHQDDCCETVTIDDICGDFYDLYNQPIIIAEESSNNDDPKDSSDESFTWTFYKLVTNLGAVTIRWYGTSNGYYSESVDFFAVCYGCGEENAYNGSFCSECNDKIAKYIPVEQRLKWWKEKYEEKAKIHN